MRYLVVYSHVIEALPYGVPVFGNMDITTDGPISSVAAVRKVEAVIARDFMLQQVVLVNLLPLTGAELPALQPEVRHG